MFTEFAHEYAKLPDGELLQLASERQSLTDDARAAVDAEMLKRGLTAVDLAKQQRFVKKSERRETTSRKRKVFGRRRTRQDWVETAASLLLVALIATAYFALPSRYRFFYYWQETAFYVLVSTAFIVVAFRSWMRKIWFWTALLISSSVQALVVHSWIIRFGALDGWEHRGAQKLAAFLGIALFLALYGTGILVSRKIYGNQERVENR